MKKIMAVAAAALAAGTLLADVKIGVVDMITLVRNHASYETNKNLLSSTEKDFQKRLDEMRSNLEGIESEGRKLAEEYRNPMLSAAAKSKIEKDVSDVQKRFYAAQQEMREEAVRNQRYLADLEARLLKSQADDLKKRIADYAKKNGFTAIFDKTAALYSVDALDVTDAVLKTMGVDPAKAVRGDSTKDESK